MLDVQKIEIFIAAAQVESITQTAEKLNLSKAAVSKQIKHLESNLKIDLFTRSKQRLHLTTQGELFYFQCLRLKKELDETKGFCSQFHDAPEGTLHLVVFEYFAHQILYPKLKGFLKKYPKLNLIIDLDERIPDFEKENVDIAIGFSLIAPDDIIRKKMATTRYVLCASPSYFKENGKPKKLEELVQHRYICHKSRLGKQSIKLKEGHTVSLTPFIILNKVTAMIECAKAEVGLIQLPQYMLEKELNKGELVEVLPECQAENANVYYYYPKYRYIQPKVRKFIDYFLSQGNTNYA